MSIADNLNRVRDDVARLCAQVGRSPEEITLVAVSKTVEPARVAEAVAAGVTDLGENWVQEAVPKRPAVEALTSPARARWHMIGHLQTNKVRKVVGVFDVVQAIDSLHLAQELNRRVSRRLPVMIEVNTSGEASKFGVSPAELLTLATEVRALPNLELAGLMTIGPGLSVEDPELARPCFKLLWELRALLEVEFRCRLPHLSMGMSSDYAVAIQEGSTMLRIGTAIFGARS